MSNFKESYIWQYHVIAPLTLEKILVEPITQKHRKTYNHALTALTHVCPIEFALIAAFMMDVL